MVTVDKLLSTNVLSPPALTNIEYPLKRQKENSESDIITILSR